MSRNLQKYTLPNGVVVSESIAKTVYHALIALERKNPRALYTFMMMCQGLPISGNIPADTLEAIRRERLVGNNNLIHEEVQAITLGFTDGQGIQSRLIHLLFEEDQAPEGADTDN